MSWGADLKGLQGHAIRVTKNGVSEKVMAWSFPVWWNYKQKTRKISDFQVKETSSLKGINIKLLKIRTKEKTLKSSEICLKTLHREEQRRRAEPPSCQKARMPEDSEAHQEQQQLRILQLAKIPIKNKSRKQKRGAQLAQQQAEDHGPLGTATRAPQIPTGEEQGREPPGPYNRMLPINTEAKQRQIYWGYVKQLCNVLLRRKSCAVEQYEWNRAVLVDTLGSSSGYTYCQGHWPASPANERAQEEIQWTHLISVSSELFSKTVCPHDLDFKTEREAGEMG